MKRVILIIMVFMLCSCTSVFKPNISITNELRVLSDREFSKLGKKWIEDKNLVKEDLRYYEFKINGSNLNNIKIRNVNIPDILDIIKDFKNLGRDIYCGIESYQQDNNSEDFFNYEYRVLINMKETNVSELKGILGKYKIYIYLKNNKNNAIKIDYNVGENLVILN